MLPLVEELASWNQFESSPSSRNYLYFVANEMFPNQFWKIEVGCFPAGSSENITKLCVLRVGTVNNSKYKCCHGFTDCRKIFLVVIGSNQHEELLESLNECRSPHDHHN